MKNSLYKMAIGATLAASALLNTGCKKSNLDLRPRGQTEASYFRTEDEFNKAVIGIYAKMTDFFWYRGGPNNSPITMFLLPGDDITTNQSNEAYEIFSMDPSEGRLDWMYKRHYQMINRAILVLDKINTVPDGVYLSTELKNTHKGEAHFLRGYAYYNLWNFFGTAPLLTERPVSTSQFTPASSKGTELLDLAIKDFEEAAKLLPPTWAETNKGRVTANSANGMLGKALVFRASAAKNAADYTAAIAAFNKIAGAQLMANFNDNFAWDTENNAESLFEFQAGQPNQLDNSSLENDFDIQVGALGIYWGFYGGRGLGSWSRFLATPKLVNAFGAGDPRLDSTINTANRQIRKYNTRDLGTNGNNQSFTNYRILRYADALLLKAEALVQSGGSTTEAIQLINQVRTRARAMGPAGTLPADYSTAESNRTTIMNWIMNERFIELAGEGQRWFDLRRWHMQGIITLDNAFFNSNLSTISFQLPKHLNFPIPNSEVNVNPNVTQNQGY